MVKRLSVFLSFATLGLLLLRPVSAADDFAARVQAYERAKSQWQESRNGMWGRSGRNSGRGGGGAGRRRRDDRRPDLKTYLNAIAALGTPASVEYLRREYRGSDSELSALVAQALIESPLPKTIRVVVRGFDPRKSWTPGARMVVLDALAESGTDEGVSFVLKLARRGSRELRPVAVTSLGYAAGREDVRTTLLTLLKDRDLSVRKAALRALSGTRASASVRVLIERLGKEKDERLQTELLRVLVSWTGHNMGLEAADWAKWWDGAEESFRFGAVSSTGRTATRTPDLRYFGIEVASKRVAFLIDASRSMDGGGGRRARGRTGRRGRDRGVSPPPSGGGGGGGGRDSKLDRLKAELTRILGELPDDTYVNIIYFHRGAVPWKKELHVLAKGGRGQATRFVQGLTTESGTNIYDALEMALEDRRVDTIFLLSDGRPVGGKYTRPADILREVGARNRVRGATIHCIGFGRETTLLPTLARENGGEYRRTEL